MSSELLALFLLAMGKGVGLEAERLTKKMTIQTAVRPAQAWGQGQNKSEIRSFCRARNGCGSGGHVRL